MWSVRKEPKRVLFSRTTALLDALWAMAPQLPAKWGVPEPFFYGLQCGWSSTDWHDLCPRIEVPASSAEQAE